DDELKGAYILAADTAVAVGRRILPKAELLDEAAQCLRLLSGRNHRVHTTICLVTPKETFRQRYVETRVRFKRLSEQDIEAYLASGEWRGKAGGYAAQGIAGAFIVKLVGSYSNIIGLPLYETLTLLGGEGYPIHFGWINAGRCARSAHSRASGNPDNGNAVEVELGPRFCGDERIEVTLAPPFTFPILHACPRQEPPSQPPTNARSAASPPTPCCGRSAPNAAPTSICIAGFPASM